MWDKWNTLWVAGAAAWACLACLDVFGSVTMEQTALGDILVWVTAAAVVAGIAAGLVFLVAEVAHRHCDEYAAGQNIGKTLVAWLICCIIAASILTALTGTAVWFKLAPFVLIGLPLFLLRHSVVTDLLARDGKEVALGKPKRV